MADKPVAKKLWLHIGTEKTGTKTIQSTCRLNRDRLIQDGILYPQTPGRLSHIKLTIFASDRKKSQDLQRRANMFSPEKYRQFKDTFVECLREEIVASRCDAVYLSDENLGLRIRRPRDIKRLANNALRSLAESITIIVYLRPQHELYASLHSTRVKAGKTDPMTPPTGERDRVYNYEKRLDGWAKVFGDENICVRIFDRSKFVGGDLIKDFFSILGYTPTQQLEIPRDQNLSLDADALEFLMIFNKHISMFGRERLNPERFGLSRALEIISTGQKLHVPEATLRGIAEIFEPSNARVAARYLNRHDGKLFDNLNFVPVPEPPPLSVERAVEITAHLWQWQQEQILQAAKPGL
jgi:hypothetical protein